MKCQAGFKRQMCGLVLGGRGAAVGGTHLKRHQASVLEAARGHPGAFPWARMLPARETSRKYCRQVRNASE